MGRLAGVLAVAAKVPLRWRRQPLSPRRRAGARFRSPCRRSTFRISSSSCWTLRSSTSPCWAASSSTCCTPSSSGRLGAIGTRPPRYRAWPVRSSLSRRRRPMGCMPPWNAGASRVPIGSPSSGPPPGTMYSLLRTSLSFQCSSSSKGLESFIYAMSRFPTLTLQPCPHRPCHRTRRGACPHWPERVGKVDAPEASQRPGFSPSRGLPLRWRGDFTCPT